MRLEELQRKYPYSGDIQLLLTKGYHSLTSINYEQQLKNTAISIPDREALFNIIYKIKLVEEIPANAKIVVKGAFYLLAASKGGGEHEH